MYRARAQKNEPTRVRRFIYDFCLIEGGTKEGKCWVCEVMAKPIGNLSQNRIYTRAPPAGAFIPFVAAAGRHKKCITVACLSTCIFTVLNPNIDSSLTFAEVSSWKFKRLHLFDGFAAIDQRQRRALLLLGVLIPLWFGSASDAKCMKNCNRGHSAFHLGVNEIRSYLHICT